MHPSFLAPTIVCRPALPLDTPAVMDLTREIWGGDDYVPHVWSEWLADPEGLLAVAEYGGKVAGLGKLTRLGFDEWWLEGLRTHPELQGRGIAAHIHDFILNYWQRSCGGVIRLVTNSKRIPVQHLCERTGFTRTNEFALFTAPALAGSPTAGPVAPVLTGVFHPLPAQDIEAAVEFAHQSTSMGWSGGLVELGWQWASPSASHLTGAVERQTAWWWRVGGEAPQALLVLREEEAENRLYIELLSCTPDHAVEILTSARSLSGGLDYAQLAWIAPLHPALLPLLASAAFTRQWEDSLFLFEKQDSPAHTGKLPRMTY